MRPREKLDQRGPESLTIEELLALIVGSGTEKHSYMQIARKISRRIRVEGMSDLGVTLRSIKTIDGVADSKASAIVAGLELGRRFFDPTLQQKLKITTSAQAVDLFDDIRGKRNEVLKCAYLNARFELLKNEAVSIGSLDQVGIHPREIITRALELNAYGVILGHNHPSGDPSPSVADTRATERLKESCDLIGIKLIDHLVVSINGWKSII